MAVGDQRVNMPGEGRAPNRSMASRMSCEVSGVGSSAGVDSNPAKEAVCGGSVADDMLENGRGLSGAAGWPSRNARCDAGIVGGDADANEGAKTSSSAQLAAAG